MRVGFQFFGGAGWTGGLNYLANLFSALAELPGRPIEPVLLVPNDVAPADLERLTPHLDAPPVTMPTGARARRALRLGSALALQRDPVAARVFAAQRIDVLFHNMAWYGRAIGIPVLAWIPDFQHRQLPHMFGPLAWAKRELGFQVLTRWAHGIVVSSEDARRRCEAHFPAAVGRIETLPFAVDIAPALLDRDLEAVRRRHALPERFLFFPGQLWKHKNHAIVVEALARLAAHGERPLVVSSGAPHDHRNPHHATEILARIGALGLGDQFRILGQIPYADLIALMRLSIAVLNPSFCEGWSTTVEEAKALGAPLVLSSLPVHREQARDQARYFDPYDADGLAAAILDAWRNGAPGPRRDAEARALAANAERRAVFARGFEAIVRRVVARYRSSAG